MSGNSETKCSNKSSHNREVQNVKCRKRNDGVDDIIIRNACKVMEANPNIDLRKALNECKVLLEEPDSVCCIETVEQKYLCSILLAWYQRGQEDIDLLVEYVIRKFAARHFKMNDDNSDDENGNDSYKNQPLYNFQANSAFAVFFANVKRNAAAVRHNVGSCKNRKNSCRNTSSNTSTACSGYVEESSSITLDYISSGVETPKIFEYPDNNCSVHEVQSKLLKSRPSRCGKVTTLRVCDKTRSNRNPCRKRFLINNDPNRPVEVIAEDLDVQVISERCLTKKASMELMGNIETPKCFNPVYTKWLDDVEKSIEALREQCKVLTAREQDRRALVNRAVKIWGDMEQSYNMSIKHAETQENEVWSQIKKIINKRNNCKKEIDERTDTYNRSMQRCEQTAVEISEAKKQIQEMIARKNETQRVMYKAHYEQIEVQAQKEQSRRDYRFKLEAQRRKLHLLKRQLDTQNALNADAERTMKAEMNSIKRQIEAGKLELSKVEKNIAVMDDRINKYKSKKAQSLSAVTESRQNHNSTITNLTKILIEKQKELEETKRRELACKCKQPVPVACQVNVTPSILATDCCCKDIGVIDKDCDCKPIKTKFMMHILEHWFSEFQRDISRHACTIPCSILVCLKDGFDWNKDLIVKTMLNDYIETEFLKLLDTALITSFESYRGVWFPSTCVEDKKKVDHLVSLLDKAVLSPGESVAADVAYTFQSKRTKEAFYVTKMQNNPFQSNFERSQPTNSLISGIWKETQNEEYQLESQPSRLSKETEYQEDRKVKKDAYNNFMKYYNTCPSLHREKRSNHRKTSAQNSNFAPNRNLNYKSYDLRNNLYTKNYMMNTRDTITTKSTQVPCNVCDSSVFSKKHRKHRCEMAATSDYNSSFSLETIYNCKAHKYLDNNKYVISKNKREIIVKRKKSSDSSSEQFSKNLIEDRREISLERQRRILNMQQVHNNVERDFGQDDSALVNRRGCDVLYCVCPDDFEVFLKRKSPEHKTQCFDNCLFQDPSAQVPSTSKEETKPPKKEKSLKNKKGRRRSSNGSRDSQVGGGRSSSMKSILKPKRGSSGSGSGQFKGPKGKRRMSLKSVPESKESVTSTQSHYRRGASTISYPDKHDCRKPRKKIERTPKPEPEPDSPQTCTCPEVCDGTKCSVCRKSIRTACGCVECDCIICCTKALHGVNEEHNCSDIKSKSRSTSKSKSMIHEKPKKKLKQTKEPLPEPVNKHEDIPEKDYENKPANIPIHKPAIKRAEKYDAECQCRLKFDKCKCVKEEDNNRSYGDLAALHKMICDHCASNDKLCTANEVGWTDNNRRNSQLCCLQVQTVVNTCFSIVMDSKSSNIVENKSYSSASDSSSNFNSSDSEVSERKSIGCSSFKARIARYNEAFQEKSGKYISRLADIKNMVKPDVTRKSNLNAREFNTIGKNEKSTTNIRDPKKSSRRQTINETFDVEPTLRRCSNDASSTNETTRDSISRKSNFRSNSYDEIRNASSLLEDFNQASGSSRKSKKTVRNCECFMETLNAKSQNFDKHVENVKCACKSSGPMIPKRQVLSIRTKQELYDVLRRGELLLRPSKRSTASDNKYAQKTLIQGSSRSSSNFDFGTQHDITKHKNLINSRKSIFNPADRDTGKKQYSRNSYYEQKFDKRNSLGNNCEVPKLITNSNSNSRMSFLQEQNNRTESFLGLLESDAKFDDKPKKPPDLIDKRITDEKISRDGSKRSIDHIKRPEIQNTSDYEEKHQKIREKLNSATQGLSRSPKSKEFENPKTMTCEMFKRLEALKAKKNVILKESSITEEMRHLTEIDYLDTKKPSKPSATDEEVLINDDGFLRAHSINNDVHPIKSFSSEINNNTDLESQKSTELIPCTSSRNFKISLMDNFISASKSLSNLNTPVPTNDRGFLSWIHFWLDLLLERLNQNNSSVRNYHKLENVSIISNETKMISQVTSSSSDQKTSSELKTEIEIAKTINTSERINEIGKIQDIARRSSFNRSVSNNTIKSIENELFNRIETSCENLLQNQSRIKNTPQEPSSAELKLLDKMLTPESSDYKIISRIDRQYRIYKSSERFSEQKIEDDSYIKKQSLTNINGKRKPSGDVGLIYMFLIWLRTMIQSYVFGNGTDVRGDQSLQNVVNISKVKSIDSLSAQVNDIQTSSRYESVHPNISEERINNNSPKVSKVEAMLYNHSRRPSDNLQGKIMYSSESDDSYLCDAIEASKQQAAECEKNQIEKESDCYKNGPKKLSWWSLEKIKSLDRNEVSLRNDSKLADYSQFKDRTAPEAGTSTKKPHGSSSTSEEVEGKLSSIFIWIKLLFEGLMQKEKTPLMPIKNCSNSISTTELRTSAGEIHIISRRSTFDKISVSEVILPRKRENDSIQRMIIKEPETRPSSNMSFQNYSTIQKEGVLHDNSNEFIVTSSEPQIPMNSEGNQLFPSEKKYDSLEFRMSSRSNRSNVFREYNDIQEHQNDVDQFSSKNEERTTQLAAHQNDSREKYVNLETHNFVSRGSSEVERILLWIYFWMETLLRSISRNETTLDQRGIQTDPNRFHKQTSDAIYKPLDTAMVQRHDSSNAVSIEMQRKIKEVPRKFKLNETDLQLQGTIDSLSRGPAVEDSSFEDKHNFYEEKIIQKKTSLIPSNTIATSSKGCQVYSRRSKNKKQPTQKYNIEERNKENDVSRYTMNKSSIRRISEMSARFNDDNNIGKYEDHIGVSSPITPVFKEVDTHAPAQSDECYLSSTRSKHDNTSESIIVTSQDFTNTASIKEQEESHYSSMRSTVNEIETFIPDLHPSSNKSAQLRDEPGFEECDDLENVSLMSDHRTFESHAPALSKEYLDHSERSTNDDLLDLVKDSTRSKGKEKNQDEFRSSTFSKGSSFDVDAEINQLKQVENSSAQFKQCKVSSRKNKRGLSLHSAIDLPKTSTLIVRNSIDELKELRELSKKYENQDTLMTSAEIKKRDNIAVKNLSSKKSTNRRPCLCNKSDNSERKERISRTYKNNNITEPPLTLPKEITKYEQRITTVKENDFYITKNTLNNIEGEIAQSLSRTEVKTPNLCSYTDHFNDDQSGIEKHESIKSISRRLHRMSLQSNKSDENNENTDKRQEKYVYEKECEMKTTFTANKEFQKLSMMEIKKIFNKYKQCKCGNICECESARHCICGISCPCSNTSSSNTNDETNYNEMTINQDICQKDLDNHTDSFENVHSLSKNLAVQRRKKIQDFSRNSIMKQCDTSASVFSGKIPKMELQYKSNLSSIKGIDSVIVPLYKSSVESENSIRGDLAQNTTSSTSCEKKNSLFTRKFLNKNSSHHDESDIAREEDMPNPEDILRRVTTDDTDAFLSTINHSSSKRVSIKEHEKLKIISKTETDLSIPIKNKSSKEHRKTQPISKTKIFISASEKERSEELKILQNLSRKVSDSSMPITNVLPLKKEHSMQDKVQKDSSKSSTIKEKEKYIYSHTYLNKSLSCDQELEIQKHDQLPDSCAKDCKVCTNMKTNEKNNLNSFEKESQVVTSHPYEDFDCDNTSPYFNDDKVKHTAFISLNKTSRLSIVSSLATDASKRTRKVCSRHNNLKTVSSRDIKHEKKSCDIKNEQSYPNISNRTTCSCKVRSFHYSRSVSEQNDDTCSRHYIGNNRSNLTIPSETTRPSKVCGCDNSVSNVSAEECKAKMVPCFSTMNNESNMHIVDISPCPCVVCNCDDPIVSLEEEETNKLSFDSFGYDKSNWDILNDSRCVCEVCNCDSPSKSLSAGEGNTVNCSTVLFENDKSSLIPPNEIKCICKESYQDTLTSICTGEGNKGKITCGSFRNNNLDHTTSNIFSCDRNSSIDGIMEQSSRNSNDNK